MRHYFLLVLLTGIVTLVTGPLDAAGRRTFTPVVPLPAPKVTRVAEEYPGSSYLVKHLIDDRESSEFASNGKGTGTFVEFDFGRAEMICGFRHIDRRDPATIDVSELVFSDQPNFEKVLRTETVKHVNKPGGTTVSLFPSPVTARFVRWRITRLNAQGHRCVGGRDVRFFTSEAPESVPRRDTVAVQAVQAVLRNQDTVGWDSVPTESDLPVPVGMESQPTDPQRPVRPIVVTVDHAYVEEMEIELRVTDHDPIPMILKYGPQAVPLSVPASDEPTEISVCVVLEGAPLLERQIPLAPVRHWEMTFLPHSHVDIGYTHVQTEVQAKQWEYLQQAIEIARNTADYPQEARFKWNTEVLWAVDSYLEQAGDRQREALIAAVRRGWIHLDGLYGNELTALCRPEELMRLTSCARRISKRYDVVIDAAMISDVPGYTWGIVPVLAQSGIKYLSIGPNHIHRIGLTLEQWGDRPFWWVSPSNEERVLCWMAGKAYSWFHNSRVGILSRDSSPDPFFAYLDELLEKEYPYDMVQIRYSIGGDNGPPDQELSEFVKAWNEKYLWPRMAISTTSNLMREFERRYGDQIPEIRGDFTPYWEDGAASSARETGLTRMASERLVQAEALWAMLRPDQYPVEDLYAAWRNVILYNEHTWGAHCSISQPDSSFTKNQWKIKQAFALAADRQSRTLVQSALGPPADSGRAVRAVDVFNTTSWSRTDLVVVDGDLIQLAGQTVKDTNGQVVASQRIGEDRLAFLAENVPPLGAKRFLIYPGAPNPKGKAKVDGNVLSNKLIRTEIDAKTGAISSLRWTGGEGDFVNVGNGSGLGQPWYVAGRDPADPKSGRATTVRASLRGGLVAAIVVERDVPGCRKWTTVVQVTDSLDRVDITNIVEKEPVLHQESVHLEFPFRVPEGVMRVDIPWAVMQPDRDQLPGSCKNYLTVGRWVDVSNDDCGITWSTLDAPLIEVGAIRVDVPTPLSSETWVRHLGPSQTVFSYLMNNYWETNYKASQEGKTIFRYSLLPHGPYDQVAATRFAIERSHPLIVQPADPEQPVVPSRFQVEGEGVLVTSLKPSADGNALMVRLWNAGEQPARAKIVWSDPVPGRVVYSSPLEDARARVTGAIGLHPLGIVTLRAEFP